MIRNSEPKGGDSGNKREQKSRAQMMAEIHAASLRGESKDDERSDNLQEAQDDVGKIAVEDTVVAQFHGSVDGIPVKGDGQFFQSMGITPTPAEEEDKAQSASSNDDNKQPGEPEKVAGHKARDDSTMKPQGADDTPTGEFPQIKSAPKKENHELPMVPDDINEWLAVNPADVPLNKEVMKRLRQSDQIWQDLEKKNAELNDQDLSSMSETEQEDWEKQVEFIEHQISNRGAQLADDVATLIYNHHEKNQRDVSSLPSSENDDLEKGSLLDRDADQLLEQWKARGPRDNESPNQAFINLIHTVQSKIAENDPVIIQLRKDNEAKDEVFRDSPKYYQALYDRQDALMIAAAEKINAIYSEDPDAMFVMDDAQLPPRFRLNEHKPKTRAEEFLASIVEEAAAASKRGLWKAETSKYAKPKTSETPKEPKEPKSPEVKKDGEVSLYEQLAAIAAQQDPETIAILNNKNLSDEERQKKMTERFKKLVSDMQHTIEQWTNSDPGLQMLVAAKTMSPEERTRLYKERVMKLVADNYGGSFAGGATVPPTSETPTSIEPNSGDGHLSDKPDRTPLTGEEKEELAERLKDLQDSFDNDVWNYGEQYARSQNVLGKWREVDYDDARRHVLDSRDVLIDAMMQDYMDKNPEATEADANVQRNKFRLDASDAMTAAAANHMSGKDANNVFTKVHRRAGWLLRKFDAWVDGRIPKGENKFTHGLSAITRFSIKAMPRGGIAAVSVAVLSPILGGFGIAGAAVAGATRAAFIASHDKETYNPGDELGEKEAWGGSSWEEISKHRKNYQRQVAGAAAFGALFSGLGAGLHGASLMHDSSADTGINLQHLYNHATGHDTQMSDLQHQITVDQRHLHADHSALTKNSTQIHGLQSKISGLQEKLSAANSASSASVAGNAFGGYQIGSWNGLTDAYGATQNSAQDVIFQLTGKQLPLDSGQFAQWAAAHGVNITGNTLSHVGSLSDPANATLLKLVTAAANS